MDGIVDSLKVCLTRPEGCGVVPGLSTDQFLATLWVSLAGGVVLGFSSKLDAGRQSLSCLPTNERVSYDRGSVSATGLDSGLLTSMADSVCEFGTGSNHRTNG